MDVSNTTQAALASTIRQDARLRMRGDDDAAQRLALRERSVMQQAVSVASREAVERPDGGASERLRTAVREAIDYQRTERTTLRLRTQEGDVVRLRFVAADSLSARYRANSDGEHVVSEFETNAQSSTRMKLMVEGDLNADEMRAIEDVVAQAREMASSFYGGDVASTANSSRASTCASACRSVCASRRASQRRRLCPKRRNRTRLLTRTRRRQRRRQPLPFRLPVPPPSPLRCLPLRRLSLNRPRRST